MWKAGKQLEAWISCSCLTVGEEGAVAIVVADPDVSVFPGNGDCQGADILTFSRFREARGDCQAKEYRRILVIADCDTFDSEFLRTVSLPLAPDGDVVAFLQTDSRNRSFAAYFSRLLKSLPGYLLADRNSQYTRLLQVCKGHALVVRSVGLLLPSYSSPVILVDSSTPHSLKHLLRCIFKGYRRWLSILVVLVADFLAFLSPKKTRNWLLSSAPGLCVHIGGAGDSTLWASLERKLAADDRATPSVRGGLCTSEKIILMGEQSRGKVDFAAKLSLTDAGPTRGQNPFSPDSRQLTLGGKTWTIDPWRQGREVATGDKSELERLFAFVKRKQDALCRESATIDDWKKYLGEGIRYIESLGLGLSERTFIRDEVRRVSSTEMRCVAICAEHGDLVASNIIVAEDGSFHLIDAENWVETGLNVFDPICLAISIMAGEPTVSSVELFCKNLCRDYPRKWLRFLLLKYYDLDEQQLTHLMTVCFIRKLSLLAREERAQIMEYWGRLLTAHVRNVLR